jgi:hypothetical protein
VALPLLDRQAELVDYLTSSATVFGEDGGLVRAPDGFDLGLLRLEAWFSHEKRLEKIRAVFAKTFEILGTATGQLVRAFTEACPPDSIGRLDNACQFHGFLVARWRNEPPDPPYLPDIADCELACAKALAAAGSVEARPERSSGRGVRRAPGVILLRCAYDVRSIFEAGPEEAIPAARDTPLAIAVPPGEERPRVFELLPIVLELLCALGDVIDPAVFGAADVVLPLISELVELGLVEDCP